MYFKFLKQFHKYALLEMFFIALHEAAKQDKSSGNF